MIQRLIRGKFVARDRTVPIAARMALLASAMLLLGPLTARVSAPRRLARAPPGLDHARGSGGLAQDRRT